MNYRLQYVNFEKKIDLKRCSLTKIVLTYMFIGFFSIADAQQCRHSSGYGTGGPYTSLSSALNKHCPTLFGESNCQLSSVSSITSSSGGGGCTCPSDPRLWRFGITCEAPEYFIDMNDLDFYGDDKGHQEPSSCNPIDLVSGNKYKIHTDVSNVLPESRLSRPGFKRIYNSQIFKNKNSVIGKQWRHTYQKSLLIKKSLDEKMNYWVGGTAAPAGINEAYQSGNYSTKQDACESGFSELKARLSLNSGLLKRILNGTVHWIGGRCIVRDEYERYVTNIPVHGSSGFSMSYEYDDYVFSSTIKAYREDGNEIKFTLDNSDKIIEGEIDYVSNIAGKDYTLKKYLSEEDYYVLTTEKKVREIYDMYGRLTSIEYPNNVVETLTYEVVLTGSTDERLVRVENNYGKYIDLTYYQDGSGLKSIENEAGQKWAYKYDSNQLLISVVNPDLSEKNYLYENPEMDYLLTGLFDERGIRYSTFNYDNDGLAISSYLGAPSMPADQRMGVTDVSYFTDFNMVIDSRGNASKYNLTKGSCNPYSPTACGVGDMVKSVIGPAGSIDYEYRYDLENRNLKDKANILEAKKFGVSNIYSEHGSSGNPGVVVEASATPEQRQLKYAYHDKFKNAVTSVSEPSVYDTALKNTQYTYDDYANITSVTINGYTPSGTAVTRSSTLKYDAPFHQLSELDGPRADVFDVYYFDYYTDSLSEGDNRARLKSVRTYSGQYPRNNIQYTTTGKLLSEDRQNGLHIDYAYYPGNDRLREVTQTDIYSGFSRSIYYTYLPTGEIKSIKEGFGSSNAVQLMFSYDDARRLIRVTDGLGNYIDYILDTEGNLIEQKVYDAAGALKKSMAQTFDSYNRLETSTQLNEDRVIDFNPDGTIASVTDGKGVVNEYDYDSLKRLVNFTQDNNGSNPQTANALTEYAYDVQDNLISVKAVNDAETTYAYDDLGNLLSRTSPDTGTVSYHHDAAGNIVQSIDAKGVTFFYSYDSNNRLLSIDAPGEEDDIYLVYDTCIQGEGKLCQITRDKSTLNYRYNAFSDVVGLDQSLITWQGYNTANNTVGYDYDAVGRVSSIKYPSGTIINYAYNAAGKIDNVHMEQDGVITNLSLNISYLPFGKETIQTYGNGISVMGFYDQAYRPYIVGDPEFYFEYISAYDQNGNIKKLMTLDESSYMNSLFEYDEHQRLMSSDGFHGQFNYTYDKAGNKQTQVGNGLETTFSYSANSNRLTELNSEATNMDDNGNITSLRGMAFTYTADNRLKTTNTGAAYEYNGLGQRAIKHTVARGIAGAYSYTQSTGFIYGLNGKLMAEVGPSGSVKKEYVYLNNQLLAMVVHMPASTETFLNADIDNDGEISVEDFVNWYHNHRTDAAYEVTGDGIADSDDINSVITCALTQSSCIASSYSTEIYYVHNDHLGTPKMLTNSNGQPVWRATATPFGRASVNNDVDGDGVAVGFNIRQPGQYYDRETGLYYNYYRYYDPETGRYITSDPIGLNGGINTYAYVENNPLRYIDPLGLAPGWVGPTGRVMQVTGGMVFTAGLKSGGNPYVLGTGAALFLGGSGLTIWDDWTTPEETMDKVRNNQLKPLLDAEKELRKMSEEFENGNEQCEQ